MIWLNMKDRGNLHGNVKGGIERLARLKIENKIKSVDQLTPREQRNIRKVWRESKRKRRGEIKVQKETADNTVTLPQSEDEHGESGQKKRGRKRVRRDRSKAYKKIKEQKCIKNLQRKLEIYKKRLQRKDKKPSTTDQCSPSPKKKRVSNLIGNEKVSPHIKKKQFFLGFALESQIKSQIKGAGTKNKKQP